MKKIILLILLPFLSSAQLNTNVIFASNIMPSQQQATGNQDFFINIADNNSNLPLQSKNMNKQVNNGVQQQFSENQVNDNNNDFNPLPQQQAVVINMAGNAGKGFNLKMPEVNFAFKRRASAASAGSLHRHSHAFRKALHKFRWKQKAKHQRLKQVHALSVKCFSWS